MVTDWPHDPVVYRVNGEDQIVFVNDRFIAFAGENGWRIDPGIVLDANVWEFCADSDVRQLYHELSTAVRPSNRAASFCYRCDSPEAARTMRMEIHPLEDGGLEFRTGCIVEEERPRPNPLIAAAATEGPSLLSMCSWCKQVQLEGEWIDVDRAVDRLGLFTDDRAITISHGICVRCRDELLGVTAAARA